MYIIMLGRGNSAKMSMSEGGGGFSIPTTGDIGRARNRLVGGGDGELIPSYTPHVML